MFRIYFSALLLINLMLKVGQTQTKKKYEFNFPFNYPRPLLLRYIWKEKSSHDIRYFWQVGGKPQEQKVSIDYKKKLINTY